MWRGAKRELHNPMFTDMKEVHLRGQVFEGANREGLLVLV